MKNLLIIVFIALAIYSIGYYSDYSTIPKLPSSVATTEEKAPTGQIPLTIFKFTDLKGTVRDVQEFKGKIIILNFWASWCGPCLEEFPSIIEVVKSRPEVQLLAISNDQNIKDIEKFLNKFSASRDLIKEGRIIIGLDPQREISVSLFNVVRLPESFIINPQFQIIKKVVGSELWTQGEIKNLVKSL